MSNTEMRQRGPLDRALSAVLSNRNETLYDILQANPEAARATITDGEHKGRQLSHVAASFGNTGALTTLVHDMGVHIDARDEAGRTALDHAMTFSASATREVLQLGANPNMPSGPEGQRPLTLAVNASGKSRDRADMAWLLISSGANPNLPNGDGSTALHVATANLDVEPVRVLLASRYTDSTTVNDEGRTARDLLKGQTHPDARQISALLSAHEARRPVSPSAAEAFSMAVNKVSMDEARPARATTEMAVVLNHPPAPSGPLLTPRTQQQIGPVLGG